METQDRPPGGTPLSRFAARLVPDAAGPAEEVERARLLASFSTVLGAITCLFLPVPVFLIDGPSIGLTFTVAEIAGCAATLAMLRRGWLIPAAFFFPLQFLAVLTGALWTNGAFDSAAVVVFPVIPLVAILLGGNRVGFLTAALQGVLLFALLGATLLGYESESVYEESQRPWLFSVATTLGCFFVASAAALFEESRRRAHADLRTTLAELKDTNRELEEARDRAEAANQAKSEFLARVSHELRTPMHGVLGMNELLLDSQLQPEQREQAQSIRRSADSLLAVIDDVLDFSSIEARKITLREERFDPRRPLDDAVRLLSPGAQRKGLILTGRAVADVPRRVVGDPDRLRQVFVNLLGNAVKYTDTGSVSARLRFGDGGLRFAVRDTGVGLGADPAELFEPFTQAAPFSTRRRGGIGLGLAICRELVAAMGGTIGAEALDDGGSLFWCEVPVTVPRGGRATQGRDGALSGRRILVHARHQEEAAVLAEPLTEWGADVVVAAHQSADPDRALLQEAGLLVRKHPSPAAEAWHMAAQAELAFLGGALEEATALAGEAEVRLRRAALPSWQRHRMRIVALQAQVLAGRIGAVKKQIDDLLAKAEHDLHGAWVLELGGSVEARVRMATTFTQGPRLRLAQLLKDAPMGRPRVLGLIGLAELEAYDGNDGRALMAQAEADVLASGALEDAVVRTRWWRARGLTARAAGDQATAEQAARTLRTDDRPWAAAWADLVESQHAAAAKGLRTLGFGLELAAVGTHLDDGASAEWLQSHGVLDVERLVRFIAP